MARILADGTGQSVRSVTGLADGGVVVVFSQAQSGQFVLRRISEVGTEESESRITIPGPSQNETVAPPIVLPSGELLIGIGSTESKAAILPGTDGFGLPRACFQTVSSFLFWVDPQSLQVRASMSVSGIMVREIKWEGSSC